MRRLVRYAFDCSLEDVNDTESWSILQEIVESWLEQKGQCTEQNGIVLITYRDGRIAELTRAKMNTDHGELFSWQLEEPIDGGKFKTSISIAKNEDVWAVSCELEAGAPDQILAPVYFNAYCPKVIHSILDIDLPWVLNGFRLFNRPLRFDQNVDGIRLAELIGDESRSLPLVVVSEFDQFVLHPGIAEDIARDLAGLAIVAVATESACWAVTHSMGKEWSCYNGAIRLYWPIQAVSRDPINHPLWTSRRLLYEVQSTEEAAIRIRKQFRRRIFGLSTLTITSNQLFREIERANRLSRREEVSTQQELIELLDEENDRLVNENRTLEEKVERLGTDLANEKAMRNWDFRGDNEEIKPDSDVPPETVMEAVEVAKQKYGQNLTFGNDVDEGIKSVLASAGPPDKILHYLKGLSGCAEALKKGSLGNTMVQWLKG